MAKFFLNWVLKFLILIFLGTVCTTLIFYKGFFITKTSITRKSTSRTSNMESYMNSSIITSALASKSHNHKNSTHYKRIILLLIDALRYDFAVYNKSAQDTGHPQHHQNPQNPKKNQNLQFPPHSPHIHKFQSINFSISPPLHSKTLIPIHTSKTNQEINKNKTNISSNTFPFLNFQKSSTGTN